MFKNIFLNSFKKYFRILKKENLKKNQKRFLEKKIKISNLIIYSFIYLNFFAVCFIFYHLFIFIS